MKSSVLIVEDEMVTALDLKAKLISIGFAVPAIVHSSKEAVDMAAELRPDVVLMDIVLQGEDDGIHAAKKISSLDIPVVFLTSYSDEKTLQKAKSTSPYGYITKPYHDKDLELALKTAIQKHHEYRDKVELIRYKGLGKGVPLTRHDDDIKWDERPRILIVEDEIITAMDLTAQLSDRGYLVVDTVTKGHEAIQKAELFRPDLVLMDIVLSGEMDGISVAEHIHDLDIPVVFLSAYTDDKTVKRAIETSPFGYVPKPYQIDELYRTIEIAIQTHRAENDKIERIDQKITSKEGEMVIEKTAVFFISAVILSLIVYSLFTRSMTWLMYLLFIPAIYNMLIVGVSLKKPLPPGGQDQPFVSILIPAHNEEFTIERCVRSLAELDYYKDGQRNYEIIVINDGSTDRTGEVLSLLKGEFEDLHIVTRKPPRAGRGKGYVLNDGVRVCQGEVIAVFDADARIDPDFLSKIIPYLDEENVAGVQARVRMYNADRNLLTMMQEVEFSIFGNVILRARDIMDKSGFLGGNGQLTWKKFVEDIEGWDGFAVTEDLNMSVKLIMDGNKIRYCPEAVVWQEAVPEWKAFFRQRVRWATGNLETLFVYLAPIIDAKIPLYKKIDAIQYLVFLLFTVFVMLGYIVAILNLTYVVRFSMEAPVIIGLISTIAFFPGVLLGIRRDKVGILKSLGRSVEYWAYCLYLIPLFFAAFIHMLTRKERRWAKTKHTGD
jgi:cellulose synthase/poly-beta-1,6-N-acetylglucosamine synthase-like glycosyltransferase/DNA-binding NarL/FixJ family response regulator